MVLEEIADIERILYCQSFFENLFRDASRIECGWPPRVKREVGDKSKDLFFGDTVLQCQLHVPVQLFGSIQRRQHRDRDQAAIAFREFRLFPDITKQYVVSESSKLWDHFVDVSFDSDIWGSLLGCDRRGGLKA